MESLKADTGLQVLAGNDTRRFAIDSDDPSAPLFHLAEGEFVSQLAVDGAGVVAVISDCRGYPPVRVVRRSPDGTLRTIGMNRSGYQVGSLITGGSQTWLSLYHAQPDSVPYQDSAVLLRATDGSDTTLTLPDGFNPRAGSGDLLVGNWSPGQGDVYGPIQLYSLTRQGIVAQFGGTTPEYVVGHGYIVWMGAACVNDCQVHRYRISDGTTSTVELAVPPNTFWATVSPDGTRVAGVRYGMTESTLYSTGHPGGSTGLVVMDLSRRSVIALPGMELAPKASPPLVFSTDGRWLVVAVNNGRTGSVLLYDRDLDHPLRTGITVPGPVLWNIPIAIAP